MTPDAGADTIVHLLRRRAHEEPDRLGWACLSDAQTISSTLTYGELDVRARSLAGALFDASVAPGDRVLVQCNQPLDFVAALVGCLYAGAIAVPLSTPRLGRHLDRLARLIRDAEPAASLTTSVYRDSLDAAFVDRTTPMRWIAIDRAAARRPDDTELAAIGARSIAYLQYTSGSTSAPKAIVVDHTNLLSNARDIARTLRVTPASRVVSWLPLFHDMGLFHGCFVPALAGCAAYLCEPGMFLRYPLRWLQACDRYGATHLAAPNFALDLCTSTLRAETTPPDLDLGRVVCFGVGSEPVRAQTLQEFAACFAPFGFRAETFSPGYGLAEASLMVSVHAPGAEPAVRWIEKDALGLGIVRESGARSPESTALVSNGRCPPGTSAVVVDPLTLARVTDDRVGEIWVHGPSVGRGYWRAEAASADTFKATLGNETYLRTGDLGFIRDGEVFITGRLKDVVIVRGRNHYPHDLELTAERSHDACQPEGACAFSIDVDGEERLVIVQEVRRTHVGRDAAGMILAIRRAVAEEHEVQLHAIHMVKPGTLPRTSSGKKERNACRELFCRDELVAVASWTFTASPGAPPATAPPRHARELRAGVLDCVARHLGVAASDIEAEAPLADYGLDSLTAVRLASELSQWLQRDLPATLVYDYPTINRLCEQLSGARRPAAHVASARAQEPIAIVGMACRFPGAENVAAFERLLFEGVDAVRPMPPARRALLPVGDHAGDESLLTAGFLDEIDRFDALFFGISPREAAAMDPQQRLLLEVAWTALEDAAISPDAIAGTDTGVFVGISTMDYLPLVRAAAMLNGYAATGNALSIAANRLSYVLDLRGPSISVDTACSSSLVAVHQACEALRGGSASVAIAGGVQLILASETSAVLAQAKMLSPHARCATFDAAADGYVRGEGCGVVVLKPLAKARAEGDRIHAVIRGCGVNQDGRSNGLTAPNGLSQEALLRHVVQAAGIDGGGIGYIETHGTGTALGDPIEVRALRAVYDAAPAGPCYLGAVKTNIGHLEAAAGIAGLLKTVLVLRAGAVPPNLHFTTLNPAIRLEGSRLRVATGVAEWPEGTGARRAAISSFGIGGTNCHAILEQAPPPPAGTADARVSILTASAASAHALDAVARSYQAHFAALPAHGRAADACYTSNVGRKHFEHRLAVVGETHGDIAAALDQHLRGALVRTIASGVGRGTPKVAYLFCGQGAQYRDMGRYLYDDERVFRDAIDRCDAIARETEGFALLDHLYGRGASDQRIHSTEIAQPALFALQYALARMWSAWGITPYVVVGHSVGEVAAAHEAGVFTLTDALRLVIARGRCMQAAPHAGAMAALPLDEAEVSRLIGAAHGEVEIAAINAPRQVVVSGDADAVARLCRELAGRGVPATRLTVSHAFHSRLMTPAAESLRSVAASIRYARPAVDFVSTVTGDIVAADEVSTAEYWCRQLLLPVRFVQALRAVEATQPEVLLEIGPAPVLVPLARETLASLRTGSAEAVVSITRGAAPWTPLLQSVARLYMRGLALDWEAINAGRRSVRVELPAYPFARQCCWIDRDGAVPVRARESAAASTAGDAEAATLRRLETASDRETVFEAVLSASAGTCFDEHRIGGQPLLPAAWAVTAVLNAGRACLETASLRLEDFELARGLVVPDRTGTTVQVVVEHDSRSRLSCALYSHSATAGAGWMKHAAASIRASSATSGPPPTWNETSYEEALDVTRWYHEFRAHSIEYGPRFRTVRDIARGPREVTSNIRLAEDAVAGDGVLHPRLLDGCFQTVAALVPADATPDAVYLPTSIAALTLYRLSAAMSVRCRTRLVSLDASRLVTDLTVFDDEGTLVASVEGFTCTRQTIRASAPSIDDWIHEVKWQPSLADHRRLWTTAGDAAQWVRNRWNDEDARRLLTSHFEAAPQLERLATAHAERTLRELLSGDSVGAISIERLIEDARIAPRHHALAARILAVLADSKVLYRLGNDYRFVADQAQADDAARLESALRSHDGVGAELELLDRCAAGLVDVLRGNRDALALLIPDGDTSLLTRLYRHSPVSQVLNAGVCAAVAAVLDAGKHARPLRVLEIGAGTGGTTAALLEQLHGRTIEYTFTDVSPHFLMKAKQEFAQFDFIDYRLFDVERAPDEQGLTPSSFDVIVAANVLHATADLARSLSHARRLLAPDGMLLIVEGTRPQAVLDLTFGATDGWWRFADSSLRVDYPLIGTDPWRAVLADTGFADVDIVTPVDPSTELRSGHSLLIATQGAREPKVAAGGTWLVLSEAGDIGDALAERLGAAGATAMLTPHADAANVGAAVAAALARDAALRAVVYACTDNASDDPTDGVAETAARRARTLLALVAALPQSHTGATPRLWIVTRAAQPGSSRNPLAGLAGATLWGMARVIARERPELRCSCIDLDGAPAPDERERLVHELLADSAETEIALHADGRAVARLMRKTGVDADRLAIPDGESYALQPSGDGRLDGMRLIATRRRAPGLGEVEIAVDATGLNFKDLLTALATGQNSVDAQLGGECAGSITRVGDAVTDLGVGDRVVALAASAFSQYVTVSRALCARLPDSLGVEEAVCIPANFLTATLALQQAGGIAAGDTALVHAATGGTGSAAVQVARRSGARVIGTAKPWKWPYLETLGVEAVASSRDGSFVAEARRVTGGRGVDVLLNSLAGDLIPQSFAALCQGGRYLEIGRSGILSRDAARALRPDVEYHIINLDDIARDRPELIQDMLPGILDAFARGEFVPPPRHVFSLRHARHAFRHMQQAQHLGKIVVDHRMLDAVRLDARGTYLLTGGFGGLGLQVGIWLAERGAGTVALLGRSPMNARCEPAVEQMRRSGARVETIVADVTDGRAMESVIAGIRASAHPLRGVIHAAGVLDDATMAQLTPEQLTRVLHPKITGAWNLHQLTAHLRLDAFVLFSSAAAVLGSAGQANHAAANAFLDALAAYRWTRGLPGLSIQWSVWAGIGAAVRKGADRSAAEYGLRPLTPADGIRALERVWHDVRPVVAIIAADWSAFERKMHRASPLLAALKRSSEREARAERRILADLTAAPVARRLDVLRGYLRERIAHVLALDDRSVVTDSFGFFELGMDSLTSMELRNELQRQFERQLPSTLTFDYPTVADLANYLAREVIALDFPTASRAGASVAPSVAHLSDAEVEAELDAELGSAACKPVAT